MLIDTHAHLYVSEFEDDREEMVRRAIENGVEKIMMPSIDSSEIASMLALEEKFPSYCFAMMGLHPCYVKESFENELNIVSDWLSKRSFIGVGEIGLDLYWDKTFFEQQKIAFSTQLEWAKKYKIPVSIHSREATDEAIEIVQKHKNEDLRGVFHCFGGTMEQVEKIVELDFFMGIGGVVTFKKAGLDVLLKDISLDHLVLETDAPYLAPVPFRGKRNESSYLKLIAEKIAEAKGMTFEEVESVTSGNAKKLFKV
jgi:TatD DNase family protein